MDEKAYLEPDFDANQLKVAQLRGILNEYGVEYSSNAKKSQLLKLFVDNIQSNSKQLLKDYKNASKRGSNHGFIKGNKTPEVIPPTEESDDVESKAKPKTRKVSRSKKTKSKSKSVEPEELSETAEPVKGEETEKSDESKPSDDTKVVKPKRKVSKSTKLADVETVPQSSESTFNNENSFQSPKEPEKKRKRKTDHSPRESKRLKSPPPAEASTIALPKDVSPSKVSKSIFESDSEEIEIMTPKKSPFKVTRSPLKTSPKDTDKQEVTKTPISQKTSSVKSPIIDSAKSSVTKVKKSPKVASSVTPKKGTRSSPASEKKSRNTSFANTTADSFKSIKEEQEHFDQELAKIDGQEKPASASANNGIDLDLASQLGIKVEGYEEAARNPIESISKVLNSPLRSPKSRSGKSNTSTPKSAKKASETKVLTPKPRLIPINDAKTLSDEETDEELEVNEEESNEDIEELEKFVEDESREVLSKLKVHVKVIPLVFSFLTWIFLLSLGLFGYWYREQQFLIGYCGNEINETTFPNTENPILQTLGDYLDNNLKPNCIPCPNHARCFPNLELGCFEDFVEFKPWNNFIFPTNKKCIPDSKKAEKLEIMIEVALDLLRTKNANKQCGKCDDIEEAGIKLTDLHDLLLSMKAPYITTQEFEQLWNRSVIELENEQDIIVRHVDHY